MDELPQMHHLTLTGLGGESANGAPLRESSRFERVLRKRWIAISMTIIIVVGVALRTYAAATKKLVGTDEASYLMAGRNLWRGDGFGDSPGHPFTIHPGLHGIVVAGFARIAGLRDLDTANGICFVTFGMLGVLALFFLARCLYDDLTAVLAAGLYATMPPLAIQVYYWDSTAEPLTLLLLVLGCYGFVRSYLGTTLRGAIVGSACFGVAAAVRSDGFVFMASTAFVLLAAKILFDKWRFRQSLACLCLCMLAFAIAYAPYGAFLYRHTDKFTTAVADVTMRNYDPVRLEADWFYRENPGEVDQDLTFVGYVVHNPGRYAKRVLQGLHALLLRRPTDLLPYYLFPFVGLALFAEDRSRARNRVLLFIAAMLAPVFCYALFYIQLRFLVIALPAILLLVARGLALPRFKSHWAQVVLPAAVLLALSLHSLGKLPAFRQEQDHDEFRQAAVWIASHSAPGDYLMTRKPQVAFYADRYIADMPWVKNEDELWQAVHDSNARYVVFDEALSLPYRPLLGQLLDKTRVEESRRFDVAYAIWQPGHKLVVLTPRDAQR